MMISVWVVVLLLWWQRLVSDLEEKVEAISHLQASLASVRTTQADGDGS